MCVPGQEPLTASMLAAAPLHEQKQMIGERLYPLIHDVHTQLAGKLTGMLLEIDNSELLLMLESPDSLSAKVGWRLGGRRTAEHKGASCASWQAAAWTKFIFLIPAGTWGILGRDSDALQLPRRGFGTGAVF